MRRIYEVHVVIRTSVDLQSVIAGSHARLECLARSGRGPSPKWESLGRSLTLRPRAFRAAEERFKSLPRKI